VQQSGHRSLTAVLKDLSASSGSGLLAGLWRGTLPSTLRTGFGSALYFTSLNALRHQAAQVPALGGSPHASRDHSSALPTLSNSANLLTGAAARTLAGFVLMPLTVIKVRYESNLYSYRSLAAAGEDIYKASGFRGFFAGFGATAVRDGPYAGLYVLFYEQMKKRLSTLVVAGQPLRPLGLGDSQATAINFTSGILAGASCSLVSNPFDAVKTRIQLQPQVYRNMLQAARKIVTEDGIRSLWDGLALRMSRKALSSALAWTAYEEIIRRAERRWLAT
jgi:solute carrier family 25, member 38